MWLAKHLRKTRRLWPTGRYAMGPIAIAISVLLLIGSTSLYLGFCRDVGTGIAARLGLVLVGPCIAAALWCLWWSG